MVVTAATSTHSPEASDVLFLAPLHPLKLCAIVLAVFFAGNVALSGQEAKTPNQDSDTVRGTVVNSVTHAAVAHALVFSADNRFAKLTDDEGHFEFQVARPEGQAAASGGGTSTFSGSGIVASQVVWTAGGAVFMARKPGYFQSQTGEPWEPGKKADLRIELVPEALIVGRVNLPVQDGTEKIQVEAYRRQVQDGHVQWVAAGSVTTRANGEFRLADLQQGDYKVFTGELLDQDPLTFNPRGPQLGYPPVYYAGAADFESAAVIHLKAGETFQAGFTPVKREYYSVKLRLLNAPQGGGFGIQVEPQGHRGPGFSLGYNISDSSIQGMLPNGNYRVEVMQYEDNGASGVLNFNVNGARVEGPTVLLAPNPIIEARVSDERTKGDNTIAPGARNLLNAMNVRLVPAGEFGPTNYMTLRPPRNQNDETLLFAGMPGIYRVQAGCNPAGYVAAVSSGGRDLLRQPLVVGAGAAVPPLEITIRDDGAHVNGRIEDLSRGGQNLQRGSYSGNLPTVVLMPLPDSAGQFCQGWVGPDGGFQFPQVEPGDYRVMVFDHLPPDLEYESTEAMKKYESKGKLLHLEPGQDERVRLNLGDANN